MGKLVPILIALMGLGAGLGAGYALRPAPEASTDEAHGTPPAVECPAPVGNTPAAELRNPDSLPAYVKLANQFVVPLMGPDNVHATVILTLSLEVPQGSQEAIYNIEPKLRDAFLRVLFDHANAGGFDGNFLNSSGIDNLRTALLEAAVKAVGPTVQDVLIVDLVKQEI